MEYADRTREAKYFDIRSGVLKQTRDSKLSPIYEPDPCVGAHKDDAFTLQGVNETVKCAKYLTWRLKFVEPATIEIGIKGTRTTRVSRAISGTSAVRPARNYSQPAVGTVTRSPPKQLPRQFRSISEHKAYARIDDIFCLQVVYLKKKRERQREKDTVDTFPLETLLFMLIL